MSVSRETLISTYFGQRQEEITRYGEILGSWGIERGLIGPKEGDRIWDRHIANCIPITSLIAQNIRLLDIGSGAGLPGIVIALARPDLKVTLLEPLQRRIDFLQEVVAELGIEVEIKRGRSDGFKGSFEVVTARAVAPLPKLATISWHLVAPGGSLLAMKGESAVDELAAAKVEAPKVFKKAAESKVHEINLGELPTARVVEIKKAG
ncbi:MAG: 16S rRNA (guanine(527)-N(7))-methyltransferase RsmG [Actinobacteria bacterium]|jgi:16S rRNA (guanine527-N7)-methyltransferase|nr:16S rRNA (guanine(527)-N(7))-methyltransferase RsmG [Actinomycetota bacterium]